MLFSFGEVKLKVLVYVEISRCDPKLHMFNSK